MSSFGGKMKEYRYISIDRFDGMNLTSRAFFLSHCHSDHMVGLADEAFCDHLREKNVIKLYCSPITQSLLLNSKIYHHLKPFVCSIPIEEETIISVPDENFEKAEDIVVTLLPAGHCPGSVMFLFEGTEGTVLYTGDFRFNCGDAARMKLLHTGESVKPIRSLYVDTTFCIPEALHIPSREQSLDAVVTTSREWLRHSPAHLVYLQCPAKYGYEYILIGLKNTLNMQTHVDSQKILDYKGIPEILDAVSDDRQGSRIHACFEKIRHENDTNVNVADIPCKYAVKKPLVPKVLNIKLSAMWFTQHISVNDVVAGNPDEGECRIIFSTHSSMTEIYDFVTYLNPENVYPNVIPNGLNEAAIIKTLKTFRPQTTTKKTNETITLGELKMKPADSESIDSSLEFDFELTHPLKKLKYEATQEEEICAKSSLKSDETKHEAIQTSDANCTQSFQFSVTSDCCDDNINGKTTENTPSWTFSFTNSDDENDTNEKTDVNLTQNSDFSVDSDISLSQTLQTDLMFSANHENSLSRSEIEFNNSTLESTPLKNGHFNDENVTKFSFYDGSNELFSSESECNLSFQNNKPSVSKQTDVFSVGITENNTHSVNNDCDKNGDSSSDSVVCLSLKNELCESDLSVNKKDSNFIDDTRNRKISENICSPSEICILQEKKKANECTPVKLNNNYDSDETPDKISVNGHEVYAGKSRDNLKRTLIPAFRLECEETSDCLQRNNRNNTKEKIERNDLTRHQIQREPGESDIEIIDSDATLDSLSSQSPICVYDSREFDTL